MPLHRRGWVRYRDGGVRFRRREVPSPQPLLRGEFQRTNAFVMGRMSYSVSEARKSKHGCTSCKCGSYTSFIGAAPGTVNPQKGVRARSVVAPPDNCVTTGYGDVRMGIGKPDPKHRLVVQPDEAAAARARGGRPLGELVTAPAAVAGPRATSFAATPSCSPRWHRDESDGLRGRRAAPPSAARCVPDHRRARARLESAVRRRLRAARRPDAALGAGPPLSASTTSPQPSSRPPWRSWEA